MLLKLRISWQSFSGENVSDSDRLCMCLGSIGWRNTDRIISICVALPKVGKYKYGSDFLVSISLAVIALNLCLCKCRLKDQRWVC
jgi:hypothetical protein